MRSSGMTKCLAGYTNSRSCVAIVSPLVGLMSDSWSISSPHSSIRRRILLVRRPDLHAVTAHAELAPLETHVVSVVLDVDELHQQVIAVDAPASFECHHHRTVVVRRTQTVNAGHARHDHHVAATHQRTGRRQSQPIDLLVDRRVFLDVDVALRNIRFRLVVIVVADEVVHRVLRKERTELRIQLRGQRLVVRNDQRRALHGLNDVGHRERLAGTGDAHQHLVLPPHADAVHQRFNRLRLVPRRRETDYVVRIAWGHW